ncbi:hypothetical protein LTR91_007263 [Friedmanniomyces endolithicus]|uniref:Uncharacterized protein n=1 Tax=Friedmanniomyces endolithicus TaxID=329885 RepID=A0AAN6QVY4_9PEZI|nr:hypothetical protein LTR94_002848 [Friedmanniomyces endolithicus]KAK0777829.1 hypothetical protein LTR38_015019 [Friedmanniomyces endolithicus]KAK0780507.1 hypothetical protein LTR75_015012 [Friedmanniomyces endolithicus]KAK0805651.1 hypothetical protein LTR59_003872 [Friedmanniomyces endolithicus]KAK0833242.1 hypothetical protein LTR03_014943 [Friedmanniomyces endolithicus]
MSTSRNLRQSAADARFKPARHAKTFKAIIENNFKLLQVPKALKKLAKSKADPEPGNENLLTIVRCQIAIDKHAVDDSFERNSEKANVYVEAMEKLNPIDIKNVLMAYIEKYQVAQPDLGTAQPHADTNPSDTSNKSNTKKRKANKSSSLLVPVVSTAVASPLACAAPLAPAASITKQPRMRKRRNAAHIEIESRSEDEGVIDSNLEDGRNAWESGTVMHRVRNHVDAGVQTKKTMALNAKAQEKEKIDVQKQLAIDLANELQERFNRIAGARRAETSYEGSAELYGTDALDDRPSHRGASCDARLRSRSLLAPA